MKSERRSPFNVARDFLDEKFPEYLTAFVAGSFNRGEDTPSSDIDLVVLLPHVERAWRESVVYDGWPIEVLVHDEETLKYFFYEIDGKEGIPSLPQMVLEGPALPEETTLSLKLKELARSVIEKGPAALSAEEEANLRYSISDLYDDLKTPRNTFEGLATVAKLHGLLAFFFFRSKGTWAAGTKHIPRRMNKLFPEFYQKWEQAFTKGFSGEFEPVLRITQEVLSENGGYLFAGYHRPAPKEWRMK